MPDPYPVCAGLTETDPVHWYEELNAWAFISLSSGMKTFAENPEQIELLHTCQVSADDAAKFEQGGLADGVSNAWIWDVTPSGLPHSNQVCLSRKRHT